MIQCIPCRSQHQAIRGEEVLKALGDAPVSFVWPQVELLGSEIGERRPRVPSNLLERYSAFGER